MGFFTLANKGLQKRFITNQIYYLRGLNEKGAKNEG